MAVAISAQPTEEYAYVGTQDLYLYLYLYLYLTHRCQICTSFLTVSELQIID